MPVSRPRTRASGTAGSRLVALLCLLLAALLVTGCGSDRSADADRSAQEAAPADAGGSAQENTDRENTEQGNTEQGTAQAPEGADGKGPGKAPADTSAAPKPSATHVVRTATLRIEVKDLSAAVEHAQRIAQDAGGYVGSETTRDQGNGREGASSRMVLRIPPDRYQKSLDDLADLGRLLERDTSATDVTGQVVDVNSRIKTQQASVERVRKLMDRAEDIGDIVALESELRTRQADLESLLARQKSLASRTGMATVTLTLTEPPAKQEDGEQKDKGMVEAVVDALGDGWHAFYLALRGLLIVVATSLPFLMAVGLLCLLVRRLRRRRTPALAAREATGVREEDTSDREAHPAVAVTAVPEQSKGSGEPGGSGASGAGD